jgi:hypothetical protein
VVLTNVQFLFSLLVFWNILIVTTGIVSASIAVSGDEATINETIEGIQAEAGFFQTIFLWVALFLINTLGLETIGMLYLGFAVLPTWLNAMLFVPLTFITIFTLVVILIPMVGN